MNRLANESVEVTRHVIERNHKLAFNISEGGREQVCRCGLISDGYNLTPHKCITITKENQDGNSSECK